MIIAIKTDACLKKSTEDSVRLIESINEIKQNIIKAQNTRNGLNLKILKKSLFGALK